MATYKRVNYSVVLQVSPGRDYPYEGLNPLTYQAGYSGSLTEPITGVVPLSTYVVSSVADHASVANGLSGLRCGMSIASQENLLPGTKDVAYSMTLLGSGGTGPYTYTLHNGTLPTGLTLTAGVISGTPTAAGTQNIEIQVVDAHGYLYNEAISITIAP